MFGGFYALIRTTLSRIRHEHLQLASFYEQPGMKFLGADLLSQVNVTVLVESLNVSLQ